jgi:hypothetical protein
VGLEATLPTIAFEVHGTVKLAQRFHDFFKHGREEKQINEVRIELGATTPQDDFRGRGGVPT